MRVDTRELEVRFTYHPPTDEAQVELYNRIRMEAKHLAGFIVAHTPSSREQSVAITKLEEAVMWANASIARRA